MQTKNSMRVNRRFDFTFDGDCVVKMALMFDVKKI
jgi:hypothetical protein